MRAIKFRAWDKSSKKMGMVQIRQMLIPDGNNEYGNQELAVSHLKFGKNPSHWLIAPILMQYTGLLDKQGKEIYEGDILRRYSYADWKVIWHEGGFYFQNINGLESGDKYPLTQDCSEGREVIGNIYETPELLNRNI